MDVWIVWCNVEFVKKEFVCPTYASILIIRNNSYKYVMVSTVKINLWKQKGNSYKGIS